MPIRRADRLFEVIQLLRGGRSRTAREIAEHLEVTERTVYRDIADLIRTGTPIIGTPGKGYALNEPIFLPPLTLNAQEYDALRLGVELVQQVTDKQLASAAIELQVKLEAVLPSRSLRSFSSPIHSAFLSVTEDGRYLTELTEAVRRRHRVEILYTDSNEKQTARLIRPLHLEFWGQVWTLTAWCELRTAFRAFRLDRIRQLELTESPFEEEPGKTYEDFLEQLRTS